MKGRSWLALLCVVGFLAMVSSGCNMVAKKKYDELEAAYKKGNDDLAAMQAENADLRDKLTKMPPPQPNGVKPPDLKPIQDAIGPLGHVMIVRGMVTVVFENEVMFAAGEAKVTPQAQATLRKLIGVINSKYPNAEVAVAGHADNQPINKSRKKYESNWDLAGARAMNVLEVMVKDGIKPNHIHFESYGEFRPVPGVPNVPGKGAAKNRRVEIMLQGLQ